MSITFLSLHYYFDKNCYHVLSKQGNYLTNGQKVKIASMFVEDRNMLNVYQKKPHTHRPLGRLSLQRLRISPWGNVCPGCSKCQVFPFFFFLFFIFLHPFQKAMLSRMEKTMTLQKKKEKKIPFQGCILYNKTTFSRLSCYTKYNMYKIVYYATLCTPIKYCLSQR